MTAEQLATNFGKKIAKPIPFGVCVETPHGRVLTTTPELTTRRTRR